MQKQPLQTNVLFTSDTDGSHGDYVGGKDDGDDDRNNICDCKNICSHVFNDIVWSAIRSCLFY